MPVYQVQYQDDSLTVEASNITEAVVVLSRWWSREYNIDLDVDDVTGINLLSEEVINAS